MSERTFTDRELKTHAEFIAKVHELAGQLGEPTPLWSVNGEKWAIHSGYDGFGIMIDGTPITVSINVTP